MHWREKNASLTQKSCEDLLRKLKIQHLDPVLKRVRGPDGAKVSYSEIMNGWSMIKTDFDLKAVGAKDVKADVFFKFNQVTQAPYAFNSRACAFKAKRNQSGYRHLGKFFANEESVMRRHKDSVPGSFFVKAKIILLHRLTEIQPQSSPLPPKKNTTNEQVAFISR